MGRQPMTDEYFSNLGARLAGMALAQGVQIDLPAMSPGVAGEILALAGTVAHTSERKFAPLATFLTGVAVGRLEAAGRLTSGDEIAVFVSRLKSDLEA